MARKLKIKMLERKPGETDDQYQKRLRYAEPEPRAQIVAIEKRGNPPRQYVAVRFNPWHPFGAGRDGKVEVERTEQFTNDDGESALLTQPTIGMVGVLRFTRSLRDGITKHWRFVADQVQPDESESEPNNSDDGQQGKRSTHSIEVTVTAVSGYTNSVRVECDNGARFDVLPQDAPKKGSTIRIKQIDGVWQLDKDVI
jgi:hypothetical protein